MNIEFLNLLKSPQEEGDSVLQNKNRGDELIWVIIHIYMEMSQGSSLCNYLKQTQMSLFFSFAKLENRREEQVLSGGCLVLSRDTGTSGRG
jgi:hypothetical protein